MRPRFATLLGAVFPGVWLGAAFGSTLTFHETGERVALTALLGGLFQCICLLLWRRQFSPATRLWPLSACLGAVIGSSFPILLRAHAASTFPASISTDAPLQGLELSGPSAALTANVLVDVAAGQVHAQVGPLQLDIEPLLTFQSRSPDGFWTIFSKQRADPLTPRIAEQSAASLELEYVQGTRLRVDASTPELRIHASRDLHEIVYSHLNSFTTIRVRGHHHLGLAFSPCPAAIIDVTHSDYPVGAPARFAYLDAHGMFRVAQASSAEKGPFTILASGPLSRGEPLGVRLIELAATPPRTLAELRVADWSRQLSTELSPTAGFDVPENSIEFGLETRDPNSPAYVMLSLADTSIGRGWDTVAHRPGHYENHLTLTPASSAPRD